MGIMKYRVVRAVRDQLNRSCLFLHFPLSFIFLFTDLRLSQLLHPPGLSVYIVLITALLQIWFLRLGGWSLCFIIIGIIPPVLRLDLLFITMTDNHGFHIRKSSLLTSFSFSVFGLSLFSVFLQFFSFSFFSSYNYCFSP
jgi:hypothetical protein